ncbi:hypothetical protein GCM10027280_41930 [Micromonospora polyrhachis]
MSLAGATTAPPHRSQINLTVPPPGPGTTVIGVLLIVEVYISRVVGPGSNRYPAPPPASGEQGLPAGVTGSSRTSTTLDAPSLGSQLAARSWRFVFGIMTVA